MGRADSEHMPAHSSATPRHHTGGLQDCRRGATLVALLIAALCVEMASALTEAECKSRHKDLVACKLEKWSDCNCGSGKPKEDKKNDARACCHKDSVPKKGHGKCTIADPLYYPPSTHCDWHPKCQWSTWSALSMCSAECGIGIATRTRTCPTRGTVIEEDSQQCQGKTQRRWTQWQNVGGCSSECGGVQQRRRTCEGECEGECESGAVQTDTVRCGGLTPSDWTAWAYTECSETCGPGRQTRSRTCAGGCQFNCTLGASEGETLECEVEKPLAFSPWQPWSPCSGCPIGRARRTRLCEGSCNVENATCVKGTTETATELCSGGASGAWASWTSWSSCSADCGAGESFSESTCEGTCDGTCVPDTSRTRTRECTASTLSFPSLWTLWSSCDGICGTGNRTRSRRCSAGCSTLTCPNGAETHRQQEPCTPYTFAHDWSSFSPCSASCGNGTRAREKTCLGNCQTANDTCSPLERLKEIETCSVGALAEWSAWAPLACGQEPTLRRPWRRSCIPNCRGGCAGSNSQLQPCAPDNVLVLLGPFVPSATAELTFVNVQKVATAMLKATNALLASYFAEDYQFVGPTADLDILSRLHPYVIGRGRRRERDKEVVPDLSGLAKVNGLLVDPLSEPAGGYNVLFGVEFATNMSVYALEALNGTALRNISLQAVANTALTALVPFGLELTFVLPAGSTGRRTESGGDSSAGTALTAAIGAVVAVLAVVAGVLLYRRQEKRGRSRKRGGPAAANDAGTRQQQAWMMDNPAFRPSAIRSGGATAARGGAENTYADPHHGVANGDPSYEEPQPYKGRSYLIPQNRSPAFAKPGGRSDADGDVGEYAEPQTGRIDGLWQRAMPADTYDSPKAANLPGAAAASTSARPPEGRLEYGFVVPQAADDDYDTPRARSTGQQPEYEDLDTTTTNEDAIYAEPTSNSFA